MRLSPAEQEALEHLLPPERRTGDLEADLVTAAREAWARRQRNTDDGGAVLAALYRILGSRREVARRTGIPEPTARRWSSRPGEDDPASSEEQS